MRKRPERDARGWGGDVRLSLYESSVPMRDVLAAVACPHSGLKRLKLAGVCVQIGRGDKSAETLKNPQVSAQVSLAQQHKAAPLAQTDSCLVPPPRSSDFLITAPDARASCRSIRSQKERFQKLQTLEGGMSERRKRADPATARRAPALSQMRFPTPPTPKKIIAFQHCHTAALAIQGIKAI